MEIQAYWIPQCNSCTGNKGGKRCTYWDKKLPNKYYWSQEACPKYSLIEGMRRPAIQRYEQAKDNPELIEKEREAGLGAY